MKKRRELDALVNGGKNTPGRRKKKGQHELLRNDTDSSDVEEYAIPEKNVIRKRGGGHFCTTCIAVTSFFLLTACVITIGGLVWVHIDLKREVDQLRNDLIRVEQGNQGTPKEFQELHSSVKKLQGDINSLNISTNTNKANVTAIFKQITTLNSTTLSLSHSVAAAQALQKLPGDVQDVIGELASLGSNVEDLKINVAGLRSLKNETNKQMRFLQGNLSVIYNLQRLLETMNSTIALEIRRLKITAAQQSAEISHNNQSLELLSYELLDHSLPSSQALQLDTSQIKAILATQLFNVTQSMRTQYQDQLDALSQQLSMLQTNIQTQSQNLNHTILDNLRKINGLSMQFMLLKQSFHRDEPSDIPTKNSEVPSPDQPTARTTLNTGFPEMGPSKDQSPSLPNTPAPQDFPGEMSREQSVPKEAENSERESQQPSHSETSADEVQRRELLEGSDDKNDDNDDDSSSSSLKESIISALRRSNKQ